MFDDPVLFTLAMWVLLFICAAVPVGLLIWWIDEVRK